jgi:hypothetical protein
MQSERGMRKGQLSQAGAS